MIKRTSPAEIVLILAEFPLGVLLKMVSKVVELVKSSGAFDTAETVA